MELTSIAFIPDGNRRYMQENGLSILEAYQAGTRKAWDVFSWLQEYPGIKVGTFWSLSLENLKRKAELPILFKIFERELDRVRESGLFERFGVRLRFLGRREVFPAELRDKMIGAERYTEQFNEKTMNVALGYSGQAEIVDASKRVAEDYAKGSLRLEDLDENTFRKYLYEDFDFPDLIVRTSGAQRLSGFLPFQSAYSELHFCKKYWPEFSRGDLESAIQDYDNRKRNFGK